MKINKRIQIFGHVQGVFFRNSTQEKARELGLNGWVRNEPDGSVLVELEGNFDAVAGMERWLRQGPPLAKVQSLNVMEGIPVGHTDFVVLK
jgi:acylphosphatase